MNSKTNVYWTEFTHHNQRYYIAGTEKGLCYVGSPDKPFSELQTWTEKKIATPALINDDKKLSKAKADILKYLNGETKAFQLDIDAIGTVFQKAVWDACSTIPYGKTKTYQEIALMLDNPKAVRAVGTAIGANPLLFIIPCHRVVAKSGSLSGFRGGLDLKRALLQLEGNSHPAQN